MSLLGKFGCIINSCRKKDGRGFVFELADCYRPGAPHFTLILLNAT
jgi:hypothetical protein